MGIDAGATVAFAAVDFDGRVVAKASRRNIGRERLIEMLAPFSPVIVASDTNPPSKLSKAIAAAFNARLSFPRHSLTYAEKSRMTRDCGYNNAHEKDAIAAALKAYHGIENKMRQAGRHGASKEKVAAGRRIRDAV
ncbi:MAG: DUF460 domain-containing protein [Candidatus Micrarchaeota archaeon]